MRLLPCTVHVVMPVAPAPIPVAGLRMLSSYLFLRRATMARRCRSLITPVHTWYSMLRAGTRIVAASPANRNSPTSRGLSNSTCPSRESTSRCSAVAPSPLSDPTRTLGRAPASLLASSAMCAQRSTVPSQYRQSADHKNKTRGCILLASRSSVWLPSSDVARSVSAGTQ